MGIRTWEIEAAPAWEGRESEGSMTKTLDEKAYHLADMIEDYVNDAREPAYARGQILRTHCDETAIDELLSMLAQRHAVDEILDSLVEALDFPIAPSEREYALRVARRKLAAGGA